MPSGRCAVARQRDDSSIIAKHLFLTLFIISFTKIAAFSPSSRSYLQQHHPRRYATLDSIRGDSPHCGSVQDERQWRRRYRNSIDMRLWGGGSNDETTGGGYSRHRLGGSSSLGEQRSWRQRYLPTTAAKTMILRFWALAAAGAAGGGGADDISAASGVISSDVLSRVNNCQKNTTATAVTKSMVTAAAIKNGVEIALDNEEEEESKDEAVAMKKPMATAAAIRDKYGSSNDEEEDTSVETAKNDNVNEEKGSVIITDEEDRANKEELVESVKQVQEKVQEVTQSVNELKSTFVEQAPSVFLLLYRTIVSREMRQDIIRVRKHYVSDWTDAFENKRQIIPATLFLYFACVAPAVSFGTIASQITNGYVGVAEFLLSSGLAGMAYALLCGQPMAFIAPTGLTLAFTSGLFGFCSLKNLPFFPIYSWVGLWTSFFMITLGVRGASKAIRYCTHFTDEVFNALLSVNFIFEALSSLRRNFVMVPDPTNLTMPFVSLAMALGTFWSTMKVTMIDRTYYFNDKIRTIIKDFGPVAIIVAMSVLNQLPFLNRFGVPTLGVSNTFQLAGGRKFLIPIMSVPMTIRLLCAFPAVLLTGLFFMDQNISVRLVNKEKNGLQKGPGYNADMAALGIITAGLSLVGLPWMCGATVQSMNHVRAMTKTKFNEDNETVEIESVTETRLSGFIIHSMIASSVLLLPLLKCLPIPVVSGVFLFLGRKLMTGNSFLSRVKDSFAEQKRLPSDHPIQFMGRQKMNTFTAVQVVCLAMLWKFKSYPATAMFFPSVIGMLMLIRSFVLPRFFTEDEFVALGDPTPK